VAGGGRNSDGGQLGVEIVTRLGDCGWGSVAQS